MALVIDANPFELRQVRQRESSVSSTRGNDDAARLHRRSVVQFDGIRRTLTLERARRPGNRDVSPELLRLNERAARQILSADAKGKTKIVLDPGARPGLPSGRIALDDQNLKPFGRAVNSGGQPARPRPDHNQVVYDVFIDSLIEPEAFGSSCVAGVSEHQLAAADQHRDLGDEDPKLIENSLRIGIRVQIDIGVRMAVPGKKLPQTQGIAGMAGSDKQRVTGGMGNQESAAQQENAKEQFAEGGIGLHDSLQVRSADLKDRACLARPASHQTAPSRELVHFAGEGTAIEDSEHGLAGIRNADDLDAAFEYHKNAMGHVALVVQHFTRSRLPLFTQWGEPCDLGVVEPGKHQV